MIKNGVFVFIFFYSVGTSGKPSLTEKFVFLYNYSLIGKV